MNWIGRIILAMLGLALIAPAVIMLYMGLFGHSFTDDQGISAFLLFSLGVFTVFMAAMP